jgi:hypothetical protein
MGLGQTAGHANTPFGTKVYYKPSLLNLLFLKPLGWISDKGKVVFRKPGVMRRSTRVLAINDRVAASPPAAKCAGKDWKAFVSCLRREMKATVGRGA